jgi:hypothetical protein
MERIGAIGGCGQVTVTVSGDHFRQPMETDDGLKYGSPGRHPSGLPFGAGISVTVISREITARR